MTRFKVVALLILDFQLQLTQNKFQVVSDQNLQQVSNCWDCAINSGILIFLLPFPLFYFLSLERSFILKLDFIAKLQHLSHSAMSATFNQEAIVYSVKHLPMIYLFSMLITFDFTISTMVLYHHAASFYMQLRPNEYNREST